jgi:CRP-like cAMP-binding protein
VIYLMAPPPRPDPKVLSKLRAELERASERGNHKDVARVLIDLVKVEPEEPRWPHRLGELQARAGDKTAATASYERAARLYSAQGFLARALAVAKMLVQIAPERADIVTQLDQTKAKELRRRADIMARVPSTPPPAMSQMQTEAQRPAVPAAARTPMDLVEETMAEVDADEDRVSLLRVSVAMSAAPMVAEDGSIVHDDAPGDLPIVIDLSDDVIIEEAIIVEGSGHGGRDALYLAHMSAAPLLADIPEEALEIIARSATYLECAGGEFVFRSGDPADALFLIVEGKASVLLPGASTKIELGEGDVLGESALLDGAKRSATVQAEGGLMLLRIEKADLDAAADAEPRVRDALFDLLIRRLIANALETCALFSPFDPQQRKLIARLFEVRTAGPGTELVRRGTRADALYLPLAGALTVDEGGEPTPLPLGTLFGHASLLSRQPSKGTLGVAAEAILLRLPATKFASFVAEFPPALAQLSELA